jgi:hypothetical protein
MVTAVLAGLGPMPALAQAVPAPRAAVQGERGQVPAEPHDANSTRDQLMDVLEQYPPALGRVLKLDPSLLTNQAYLAPYPALSTFLTQHPDVVRNPAYFLERVSISTGSYYDSSRTASQRMWEDMMAGTAVVAVVITIVGLLTWLVRTLIDYRRWHRLSRVQAEVHSKLLDRFTANDELIAYVQSPAGSRFLSSAPITLEPNGRTLAAPFGRILWSVQAGLVLAMAGIGLQYASGRVTADASEPLMTIGILALMLGTGFILSAFVAYLLSKRLGLFEPHAASTALPPARHDTPLGS